MHIYEKDNERESLFFFILSTTALSSCQLISPMITDYNGVRRDVATYINSNLLFSLKDREILVKLCQRTTKDPDRRSLKPNCTAKLSFRKSRRTLLCKSAHIFKKTQFSRSSNLYIARTSSQLATHSRLTDADQFNA